MRAPNSPQNEATRSALLEAAAPIFARDGFQIARIREIAEAAGANLSAINYHFGSKEGLYKAVLGYTAQLAIDSHPLLPQTSLVLTAPERFRTLVGNMLRRFVDVETPSLMARLMVREMANPTLALDTIIETASKPQFAIVSELIAELLGPAATEERIRHCTLSLMGQVVFYLFGRPVVLRLFPQTYHEKNIQQLEHHIAEFSLAGIQVYRDQVETRSE